MHPADLEALVDRELKALPRPRAPRTLLPRVMATVAQCSRRPWYRRAWLTWPLGYQLTSAVALTLLVGAGVKLLPGAWSALDAAASRLASGAVADVVGLARHAEVTTHTVRVLWRTVLEPLIAYAFSIVVLMGLACAAGATALNRLASGRTSS